MVKKREGVMDGAHGKSITSEMGSTVGSAPMAADLATSPTDAQERIVKTMPSLPIEQDLDKMSPEEKDMFLALSAQIAKQKESVMNPTLGAIPQPASTAAPATVAPNQNNRAAKELAVNQLLVGDNPSKLNLSSVPDDQMDTLLANSALLGAQKK